MLSGLGKEVGRFEATVKANQWLQTLMALVKGDGVTSAGDARLVGLAVLRGLHTYIQQNQGQISLPFSLTTCLGSAIREFERWKA